MVKKENLKGHVVRVHPKRRNSLIQTPTVMKSGSIFRSHRKRNIAILALVALAVIGLSIAASQFADANTMKMHWHPKVLATITGSPASIPPNIGIDANLHQDHSLDQYGIGMAPLHTHDDALDDGYRAIHQESNTIRDFTLQDFLRIWGQSLTPSQVLGHPVDSGHRAYLVVDGVQMGPTDSVVLKDGQRIQIVCGP